MDIETNFNFKSQPCTSREQSERLLALGLKKETADCNLTNYSLKGKGYQDDWQIGTVPYCEVLEEWNKFAKDSCWELIPAWSLGRLIEMYAERYISCSMNLKDLTYEWIINEIEIHIKEGDFNKDYLV